MRAWDVNATGCPSCRNAAPTPDCDASHWRVTSLVTSYYCRTGDVWSVFLPHQMLSADIVSVPLNTFRFQLVHWFVEMLGRNSNSEEPLHRGRIRWLWHFLYSFDFFWVRFDFFERQQMSNVWNFSDPLFDFLFV